MRIAAYLAAASPAAAFQLPPSPRLRRASGVRRLQVHGGRGDDDGPPAATEFAVFSRG